MAIFHDHDLIVKSFVVVEIKQVYQLKNLTANVLLIIFAVFFGIKGATKSISYSLKIILSISLPFLFYKRVLNFSLEKF